jgi:hypothetical protein
MAAKTNQSISDVLNYILRNAAPSWGALSSLNLSLHTAAPGLGGDQLSAEATYTGYARIALTRSGAGAWTLSSGGTPSVNNALIQFGNCTGGTLPQVITHVGLGENSSGAGTLIYVGALTSALTVNLNIQPQFAISALSIVEA